MKREPYPCDSWLRIRAGLGCGLGRRIACSPSNQTRENDEHFPYEPRFRKSIGHNVANNKLRKHLANQGRETAVFKILGWKQEGQDTLNEELPVCRLVLGLFDDGGRDVYLRNRR